MTPSATSAELSFDMLSAWDLVPAMIWVAGPDGACRHVNTAWREFTGRKLEDSLGDGWLVAMCCVPCDCVPIRSWPLFRARELMQHLIESFTPTGEATSASPVGGSRAGGVFLPPGEAHP